MNIPDTARDLLASFVWDAEPRELRAGTAAARSNVLVSPARPGHLRRLGNGQTPDRPAGIHLGRHHH